MSSPLAIAAVTAGLKDLLNNGFLDNDLSSIGSFTVTALPPDRVTVGATEPNQLNLFLYQVTANPGWRNVDLPARDGSGGRLTNPPLALDLHYLLTAYGSQDFNAEILLGYAMHLLHENPVLSRAQLRTVLGGVEPVTGQVLPPVPPFNALSAIDLADQVELIKITPVFLTPDDLSKMWTAMQARYRPTVGYLVSVVLIQGREPTRAAPPVLKRGTEDRGAVAVAGPFPNLTGARNAASDLLPAIRLGDDLLLSGTNLDAQGTFTVVLTHTQLDTTRDITPLPPAGSRELRAHVPSMAERPESVNEWTIGVHTATVRVGKPDLPAWSTNGVPIAIAPQITVSPLSSGIGDLDLTVTCSPRLRPEQEPHTVLIFGSRTVEHAGVTTPADPLQPSTLTFTIEDVAAGDYIVRLRVGGIDSLPIVMNGEPPKPEFDAQQRVHVA